MHSISDLQVSGTRAVRVPVENMDSVFVFHIQLITYAIALMDTPDHRAKVITAGNILSRILVGITTT